MAKTDIGRALLVGPAVPAVRSGREGHAGSISASGTNLAAAPAPGPPGVSSDWVLHFIMLKWLVVIPLLLSLGACGATSRRATGFDGDRAFDLLRRQCDFGPRPVGTPAHEKTRAYLASVLRANTDYFQEQDYTTVIDGKPLHQANLLGLVNPTKPVTLLICAHWDTRPTADQDPDPAKRNQPILGADDGASDTAVVIELARVLKARPPAIGVAFALFDGEDYGPNSDHMYLGARYFAAHPGRFKPNRAILVDMVGDTNLDIYEELNSLDSDRQMVHDIWAIAAELGYAKQFPAQSKYSMEDDHIPLQQAGIPAIDVIDFDYPPWHTTHDTVDKCSPKSLGIVGRVLETYIRRQKS